VAEDYLKKETLIWEGLLRSGQNMVAEVRRRWPRGGVPRMLFAWPAGPIKADDGTPIKGMIPLVVPEEVSTSKAALGMVKRANAYALLLVEQRGDEVKVILEAPQGARCWTLPVRRHGDVTVVEEGFSQDNEECLGVLWQKS
jgi:hypothetical protein